MAHQAVEQWILARAVAASWVTAGVGVLAVLGKYLPRSILEYRALWAKDEVARLVALEALRLRHQDAAAIASYINVPPGSPPPSPSAVLPSPRRFRIGPRRDQDSVHKQQPD
jgi:hypothetical protein